MCGTNRYRRHHVRKPLRGLAIRKKSPDLHGILRADEGFLPKISLSFGGLTRQDMAMVRFFPLDLTTLENGETFCRTPA